jgi:hypothetical protein
MKMVEQYIEKRFGQVKPAAEKVLTEGALPAPSEQLISS